MSDALIETIVLTAYAIWIGVPAFLLIRHGIRHLRRARLAYQQQQADSLFQAARHYSHTSPVPIDDDEPVFDALDLDPVAFWQKDQS